MPTQPRDIDSARGGLGDIRPLAPEEFEQIRQLAYRTFGLDLKAGKEELVSARLRRLLRSGGFASFHEYYRHIVNDGTGESLARMIDALTTNHTSFLREPAHFHFLQNQVGPLLKDRSVIELWCAASSTGEEVWTLAFVLNDLFPHRDIHILASDISQRVLHVATRGMYPADRCSALPGHWLKRYFEPASPGATEFRVRETIRSQVTFRRHNLVEPFTAAKRFPVIFCRNVMIYFDKPTQERVVGYLSTALEAGGYLFVGHAESLTRVPHTLEYVQPAVYRKPAKGIARQK